MYKDKRILGLITARGGSKSIPRKNIKEVCGKPLIAYTIESAKKSKLLTRFYVDTDDKEIADISKKFGSDIPYMRPDELAQDESTSLDVAKHALWWLKENYNEEYDYLMFLQPTGPLRTAEDIDNCIKKAIDTGADSVMSMKEFPDFGLEKVKIIKDDTICPVLVDEGTHSKQRQDQKQTYYRRNAQIFLTKTEYIMKNDLFGIISRPYVMPQERSLDINDPVDFELAEFWIKRKNKEN